MPNVISRVMEENKKIALCGRTAAFVLLPAVLVERPFRFVLLLCCSANSLRTWLGCRGPRRTVNGDAVQQGAPCHPDQANLQGGCCWGDGELLNVRLSKACHLDKIQSLYLHAHPLVSIFLLRLLVSHLFGHTQQLTAWIFQQVLCRAKASSLV